MKKAWELLGRGCFVWVVLFFRGGVGLGNEARWCEKVDFKFWGEV